MYDLCTHKPLLLLLTNPGLEESLLIESKKAYNSFWQLQASGCVPIFHKNNIDVFKTLLRIRGANRYILVINALYISSNIITKDVMRQLARETSSSFEFFAESFIGKYDKIAFRGIRRERKDLWKNEKVRHEITSVDIARIIAEEYLKEMDIEVDLRSPTISILALLFGNLLIIGWDLLGDANKLRKYRSYLHPAGLRPTAATNMFYIDKKDDIDYSIIYDPMCGAGTIPLEVMSIIHGVSILAEAGLEIVAHLGHKLLNDDKLAVNLVREHIKCETEYTIMGSDISPKYVRWSIENLRAYLRYMKNYWNAEFRPNIKFFCRDILSKEPEEFADIILVNPPYGIRSSRPKALPMIYRKLAKFSASTGSSLFKAYTVRKDVMIKAVEALWRLRKVYPCYLESLRAFLITCEHLR